MTFPQVKQRTGIILISIYYTERFGHPLFIFIFKVGELNSQVLKGPQVLEAECQVLKDSMSFI